MPAAFPPGRRILCIADSFGVPNGSRRPAFPQAVTETTGAVALLEAISFGQFIWDIDLNFSVAGQSSTALLARYGTDVAARYADFDILWIDCGRNDPDASKSDGDTTISNIVAMASLAIANNKCVLVFNPNPPRSSGILSDAQRKVRAYVNEQVKIWCEGQTGTAYIDVWRDWVDPTTSAGSAAAGILYDGLHPDISGAVFAARRALADISFAFPLSPRTQSAWDWYDPALNPTGNLLALRSLSLPRMPGTGGSISTFSGVIADDFDLTRSTGTGTQIVASKEPAVAGYDSNGGERQILAITALSGPTVFIFQTDISVPPPSGVLNNSASGQFEIELSGIQGCTGLGVLLQYWDGSANQGAIGMNNGTGSVIPWPDGKYLFRSPSLPISPSAQNLQLILFGAFNVGGAGTITVGAPIVRPIY